MSGNSPTIVHRVHAYASGQDAETAGLYGFWDPKAQVWREVPFAAFARSVVRLSHRLIAEGAQAGDIALLVTPTPAAALTGFYACLLAGIVPALHPDALALRGRDGLVSRLQRWKARFGPRTRVIAEMVGTSVISFEGDGLTTHSLSAIPDFDDETPVSLDGFTLPSAGDLAYLQVTSGSTGDGKATALTHGNLVANASAIMAGIGIGVGETIADETEVCLSWLPLYHDMGLVGGTVCGLLRGFPCYIMRPFDFLMNPALWISAASDLKITFSPAPNFGYSFAARSARAQGFEGADLSRWRVAFCGAEPVRAKTLSDFVTRFGPYGFRAEAFLPCYGLAETTLAVTFPDHKSAPTYLVIDRRSIAMGAPILRLGEGVLRAEGGTDEQAYSTVPESQRASADPMSVFSLGRALEGLTLCLKNTEGTVISGEGISGEVWVSGTSLALGYLRGNIASPDGLDAFDNVFQTGDLGFIHQGELYLVDRLKNILIRNGQNYPVSALEASLAELSGLGEQRFVVFEEDPSASHSAIIALCELPKRADIDAIIEAIRSGIDLVDLPIRTLIFVGKGGIPKTTSGKKRHAEARSRRADGTLKMLREVALTRRSRSRG